MTVHNCPVCGFSGLEQGRPACEWCADPLPGHLHEVFAEAWDHRMLNPGKWQETLAEVLQWHHSNPHRD